MFPWRIVVVLSCLIGFLWLGCDPTGAVQEPTVEPAPLDGGVDGGHTDSPTPENTNDTTSKPEPRPEPQIPEAAPETSPELPVAEVMPDGGACMVPTTPPGGPAPGVIRTERGWVKGAQEGNTWAYKGIPFAAPPTGALRWKPPEAHVCWSDLRESTSFGNKCPQVKVDTNQNKTYIGQEDCLTLNIWSPKSAQPSDPKAVMFFIHGGGNIQGSSSQSIGGGQKAIYNGQYLAETHDVVVVSINYRLGALGFFAHPTLSQENQGRSGNYGILDQIFALKWVQRNIKAFSGDPSRVMVFGESAGAVNTCVHMASPLSKGLFHRALMQSGTCRSARLLKDAEQTSGQIIAKTSCQGDADPIACLRKLSSESILKEMPGSIGIGRAGGGDPLEQYAPIVDGWVLKQSPIETIRSKAHNDVPFVVGSNLDEMEAFLSFPIPTEQAYINLVKQSLSNVPQALVDQVLKVYDVTNYKTPRDAYLDLSGDVAFTCAAWEVAKAAAEAKGAKAWRYFFQRRPVTAQGELPATHGLELLYVFGTYADIPFYKAAQEDVTLSQQIMAFWANFAKSGSPNPTTGGAFTWTAYDPSKDNTILLDAPLSMKDNVRKDRCELWEQIFNPQP